MAKEGLFFLKNYNNQPPQHLTTFVDDVIEYISYMSNRSSGAVGIPNDIDSLNNQIEEIKNKQEILLDKFLDGTIPEELYKKKNIDLQNKIDDLNQRIEKQKIQLCTKDYITDRVAHLKDEIEKIIDQDLSLQFVYEHIEKIIVHPAKLEIMFDVLPQMEVEVKKINYRRTEYICL